MSFVETQQQFVAWLRDPKNNPLPEHIEPRRLAIYRRLVRNNVESFLGNGFPILRARTAKTVWNTWVDKFLQSHAAHSPYFSEIGREFVDFLAQQDLPEVGQLERELARYERMEVDVLFASIPDHLSKAQSTDSSMRWVVSPAVAIDQFFYPVMNLKASMNDASVKREQPLFILVYRAAEIKTEGQIQFLELTPLTAVLIELLQQYPKQTTGELLARIQPMLPQVEEYQLQQGLQEIVTDFAARSVLLVQS